MFRARWGETLTANVTIETVLGIAMIPGGLAVGAGPVAFDDSAWATGAILLSIGIVLIAPLLALDAALTQLLPYALFRESTGGECRAIHVRRRRRCVQAAPALVPRDWRLGNRGGTDATCASLR